MRGIALAAVLFVPNVALADCGTHAEMIAVAGHVSPAVVKIQTISAQPGCETVGTGFLVSSGGYILTAKHVVPAGCIDQSIRGLVAYTDRTVELEVVDASATDAALLRIVGGATGLPSLSLLRPIAEPRRFQNRTVVIVSFDDAEPIATLGRVLLTRPTGEPYKWRICGAAANPGRSGSPVIMQDGSVAAIFVDRPVGDQDIASILPVANISDIDEFDASPPSIASRSQMGPALPQLEGDQTALVELAPRSRLPNPIMLVAALPNRILGRPVDGDGTVEIRAPAGLTFDRSSIDLRPTGASSTTSAVPECTDGLLGRCFVISDDFKRLSIRTIGSVDDVSSGVVARVRAESPATAP